MCTVSWMHSDGGYQLFCNRDERRGRESALPPRLQAKRGVRFVAPIDGTHGGTWILVNEHGVTICLLNGACVGDDPDLSPVGPTVSRGLFVMEMADARSSEEVCTRASVADLACYAPFTLLALETGQPASVVEWNGEDRIVLSDADMYMPLTSSSFDGREVRLRRRERWRRLASLQGTEAAARHWRFHADHGPAPGPYSPCMHREDAETVSFSRVVAGHEKAEFYYSSAAPCQGAPLTTVTLALL